MHRILTLLLAIIFSLPSFSDEGMWMINRLNRENKRTMRDLGFTMSFKEIYHPRRASLKDAIVNFGGFCSGVIVSQEGLVFTNHHCALQAIQYHSSPSSDLLKDGFVAKTKEEELSNPNLYIRMLVRVEDVTQRVLKATDPYWDEAERQLAVDSVSLAIEKELHERDSTLIGVVDSYYAGNEYWLSIYKDYEDVRLVFAPPSSIGKFGWDSDNWVWPRHTGDFCVFRIYVDKENNPAKYSPANVPFRPKYVAPISTKGYQAGDYTMTIGYPGSTDRYLSSYGIEERMHSLNQALIDVRGVKQAIWKRGMEQDKGVKIKYASKYAESSNYWKNSIGANKAIEDLKIIEQKRNLEAELEEWIRSSPNERARNIHLLTDLGLAYRNRRETMRAMAYFVEAFMNGPELLQLALQTMNFDYDAADSEVVNNYEQLIEQYSNLDLFLDREVFVAMLKGYREWVDERFLPLFYQECEKQFQGDYGLFADYVYGTSRVVTPQALSSVIKRDTTFQIFDDPAVAIALDLIVKYYEMSQSIQADNHTITKGERELNAAIRRKNYRRNFYPDANFTMRLSMGSIEGYRPKDAVTYHYRTTVEGIFEKTKHFSNDPDFQLEKAVYELLKKANKSKYVSSDGEFNICFISNNDITGGNSGSAVFNGKGELLGLAFDGNWEAISSDVQYEAQLQRCIGVDIRYLLFLLSETEGANSILDELIINK